MDKTIEDASRSLTTMTSSDVVTLKIRQDPQQAVATPENKEKSKKYSPAIYQVHSLTFVTVRKPIDPPPIVELDVSSHHDAGRFARTRSNASLSSD